MTYAPDPKAGDAVPVEPAPTRRGFGCLLEIVETLVLTLVIYLLIHNFIAQPFEVDQNSMVPTITPHEYVLIDKLTPRFGDYERGDVVVFDPPAGHDQGGIPFIKRVIGLPGETVTLENGRVFITPAGGSPVLIDEPYIARGTDGQAVPTQPKDAEGTSEWIVPGDSYFVMGDNRVQSQDSRFFGPVERELIVGRAWLRYFPIDRIGFMDRPDYQDLPAGDEAGAAYPLGGSSATIQASIARR
ncbi:MAG: signal peptidase I [Candidatus Limnocylindria bacterium]